MEEKTRNLNKLVLKCLPYFSMIAFLIGWELLVVTGVIQNTLLASPSQVIVLFFYKLTNINPDGSILAVHMFVSIGEALIGYLLAVAVGIPLGMLMGWYKTADGLARPIFEMIRPIPPVAWIPLAIVWFGVGWVSKIFIIWASGIVPCVINSYAGVRMTNPTLIRMARAYGASEWEIFKKVCVPSAMPMVFAALEISLAYSWSTLVAAELVAADVGLGYLIQMGRRLLMPDMILLGMVVIGITGMMFGLGISRLRKYIVRY